MDALAINFSLRSPIVSQEDLPAIRLKAANRHSSPNTHSLFPLLPPFNCIFIFLFLPSGAVETFLLGTLYSWHFHIPVGLQCDLGCVASIAFNNSHPIPYIGHRGEITIGEIC
jgi:hypothetical protein